jgi:integral membrane sensor domain MASE1
MSATEKTIARYLAEMLGLAGIYFATALVGLHFDAVSGFAALIWPPSGIALAAVLLLGKKYWPAVALGALAANFVTGAPWFSAMGIAAGNAGGAVLGSELLRRAGFRPSMDRLWDALYFIGLAAIVSTLLSPTVGVTSLWVGGVVTFATYAKTWVAWWVGDALGILVFGTLLIAMRGHWRRKFEIPRRGESAALAAIIVIPGVLTFVNPWGVLGTNPPIAYLMFIPLVWAALRFGRLGTALATTAVSVIAVWGTVSGSGPFIRETVSDSLLHLQLYTAVIASTSLILASVDAERRRAEKEATDFGKSLERKVIERTTQLEKANQELASSKTALEKRGAVLQAVLHSIGEGVAAIDTSGSPIVINPAAMQLTGLEPSEIIFPLEKLLERATTYYLDGVTAVPMADLPISRALRGEVTTNERLMLKSNKHPEGVIVSVTGTPITDPRGGIIGGVVVFREVPLK